LRGSAAGNLAPDARGRVWWHNHGQTDGRRL